MLDYVKLNRLFFNKSTKVHFVTVVQFVQHNVNNQLDFVMFFGLVCQWVVIHQFMQHEYGIEIYHSRGLDIQMT